MAIKDVLVYVDNDAANGNRVLTAANLCAHFGAHLSGIYVMRRMTVPAYPGADFTVAVYDAIEKQAIEQQQAAQNEFSARLKNCDIKSEFRSAEDDVAETLAVQSRYADLLVLPQQKDDESNQNIHYLLASVLINAACPVLVLSDSKPVTLPPHKVMIAWDGSRESARALKSAMPLLARVDKIDVVSVESNDAEAIDITRYITRHGFRAETHLINSSKRGVGQALLEKAAELDSQLMVMGAYGHSRFRELVLGGTTKYVTQHAHLPVLLAH